VGPDLLELARWVSWYYCSSLGEALRAAAPFGRRRLSAGVRRFVRLAEGIEAGPVSEGLKDRAPLQARIVGFLGEKGPSQPAEIRHLGPGTAGAVKALTKKGLLEVSEQEVWRRPLELSVETREAPPTLTPSQENALSPITEALEAGSFRAFLLHGVTGSGKTEIYLRAIAQALERGRSACVLVPEIALTPQLVQRFHGRFPSHVAVIHSGLSAAERSDQWRSLREGRASICVGARSAVFASLRDVGVLVVDEEHDSSYKQEESPRYHAREVALVRARDAGAVAILGSATPSLESRYNVDRGKLTLLEIPERILERPLPKVEVVDLRGGSCGRRGPVILSQPLAEALRERSERGEQAILLLNRRGFANFIQCVDCGHVFSCLNCSVSLTFHAVQRAARCHWCDSSVQTIKDCPGCGGALFHYAGLGTQRVEEEVKKLLPGAAVARMDRDTTAQRGAHRQLIRALEAGEIDVLVGTQMIAKGHDYPNVTLVGAISADTSLHVPDFRAAERTFQLLTQVAGRTGRGEKGGEVIVQTYMPDHYAVSHATRHDFTGFYVEELARREAVGWPPFSRIALLRLEGMRKESVEAASEVLAAACQKEGGGMRGGEILGPAWAAVARVKNRHRRQILLKHSSAKALNGWIRSSVAAYRKKEGGGRSQVALKIDVDPISAL
jgi:primosomal protein N' (replication factor Y)